MENINVKSKHYEDTATLRRRGGKVILALSNVNKENVTENWIVVVDNLYFLTLIIFGLQSRLDQVQ